MIFPLIPRIDFCSFSFLPVTRANPDTKPKQPKEFLFNYIT